MKTGCGKNRPTLFKDWPWLLFIVIAKETEIGNCLCFRMSGHFNAVGDKIILGIKTLEPIFVPIIIFASITQPAS